MPTTTIRIGGVPEHFNLPIHLAIERGAFKKRNVDLQWTTYKGGTGQMTKALRDDEIDLCVLLTEGIITDIVRGNPSKLISVYVNTPLTWGIHTSADSDLYHYDDIFERRYAISRFGSGSHLMAIVDANSKGRQLDTNQFEVIGNLENALTSLTNKDTDVFYWEKYTTKPYVNNGMLRRIGEYTTPWPCFVIAATEKILAEEPQAVIRVLRTIHDSCDRFMVDEKAIRKVSKRFDLPIVDAQRWFHSTEWAIHGWITDKMLKSVTFHLRLAGILEPDQIIPPLVWERPS